MDPQNCVTSGSDLNKYVDPKKSARISVCYKNLTFFVGYPTYTGFTNSRWPTDLTLWALPGGENGADDKGNGNPLSGQKWGGLTLKDLVIRYVSQPRTGRTDDIYLLRVFSAYLKAIAKTATRTDGISTKYIATQRSMET